MPLEAQTLIDTADEWQTVLALDQRAPTGLWVNLCNVSASRIEVGLGMDLQGASPSDQPRSIQVDPSTGMEVGANFSFIYPPLPAEARVYARCDDANALAVTVLPGMPGAGRHIEGPQGVAGATGATGPAGPAPAGTGFVTVTGGVLDTPSRFIPSSSIRRFYQWKTNVGLTTINSTGASAPSTSGTATNIDDASGAMVRYRTAAVINSLAFVQTSAQFRRNWLADVTIFAPLPATITTARWHIGLVGDALGTFTSDAPTTDSYAVFRYSTAADGTAFWRTLTCNASAVTTTTTTVAVTAGAAYEFRIRTLASSVVFEINGVVVATHTTNLPVGTTNMHAIAQVETLAAAARDVHWGSTTGLQAA